MKKLIYWLKSKIRIYLVYYKKDGYECVVSWFFTHKSASNYAGSHLIRDIDMNGNSSINHTTAYIDLLKRKNSGVRQKNSIGGYGV